VPFVGGVTRHVYEDADGRQQLTGYDGERVYGVWLMPVDEPVIASGGQSCRTTTSCDLNPNTSPC
jgi:hypothetical protein